VPQAANRVLQMVPPLCILLYYARQNRVEMDKEPD
jgi:hypothetical protein